MAKVVGDIAVRVGADVSPLRAGMAKGSKSVKDFESKAAKMGKTFAKVSIGLGAAAAGAVAAISKMAESAGGAATEIQNLSTLSGINAEEFQRLAAAADTVGFSQEKLADIFKDTNDKFGDFMANGAGPLKDFFDNIAPAVGVTAEQFAALSGPDALQLYVSSLEKAGVSQQQMTFYMEALASDATALIPLLANNGREMRALGDAASDAGRIISNEAVTAGAEMDRKMRELSDTLRTQATAAVLEYSDEIIAAADFITGTLLPAIGSFIEGIGSFVSSLEPAISALQRFIGLAQAAAGVSVGSATPSVEDQSRFDADVAAAGGGGDPSSTGVFYVDESGNVQEYGQGAPAIPTITAPAVKPNIPTVNRGTKKSGGGGGGRGGGGSRGQGPTLEDLDALKMRYAEEDEIVKAAREKALTELEEFRSAKLLTEEEYNSLEAQIKQEHEDKLTEIENRARADRLQAFSGAFGDLATLMQSENKKLFKIGKAAAIAEATVSGYGAAVSAWEKGMKVGGPPVAAAFTAASLAKTGALISSISSAQSNGSGAATSSAAVSTGATETQSQGRIAEVIIQGDYISAASVYDLLNQGADQGYTLRSGVLA